MFSFALELSLNVLILRLNFEIAQFEEPNDFIKRYRDIRKQSKSKQNYDTKKRQTLRRVLRRPVNYDQLAEHGFCTYLCKGNALKLLGVKFD